MIDVTPLPRRHYIIELVNCNSETDERKSIMLRLSLLEGDDCASCRICAECIVRPLNFVYHRMYYFALILPFSRIFSESI